MKKITYICGLFVFVLAFGVFTPRVQAETSHTLYTLSGFVEFLIESGMIPSENVQKARELGVLIGQYEDQGQGVNGYGHNADSVEVEVSQFIEYGTLEYQAYEDIEGLLLLVTNVTDESVVLEAKRECQVTYKIFTDNDELVYDSSTERTCVTEEQVKYQLDVGETRMFEITHSSDDKKLERGEYIFEIEYPGYGKGERLITIL